MKSLTIRLSEEQYSELRNRAGAEGLTLSNYIRRRTGLSEQQRGERKDMIGWGIRRHTHGGSSRQNPLLAAFADRDDAEKIAKNVNDCAICNPAASKAVFSGECYEVVRSTKHPMFLHRKCPPSIANAALLTFQGV